MAKRKGITKEEAYKRFSNPRVSWLDILSWIEKKGNTAVCIYDIVNKFKFSHKEASARLCKLESRKYIKEINKYEYETIPVPNPRPKGRPYKYYGITERGLAKIGKG